MAKKRKSDDCGGGSEEGLKRPAPNISQRGIVHGEFTSLNKIRGSSTDKLAQLHSIRDRRLAEPQDSPNRMEDVCYRIPDSLSDANLDVIGYHRGCYQNFTNNLDHLKRSMPSNVPSTSRSPRKPLLSSVKQLFPPECIFCEKVELKVSGKTKRCKIFPVFKGKDGTLKYRSWKQIEPRVLELGNNRLHRLVQGEDLFARETRFHQHCRISFNLKYTNYLHCTSHATDFPIQTEQARKAAAHLKAFNVVLDVIEDQVIGENKVMRLSSLRLIYTQELERNDFLNTQ